MDPINSHDKSCLCQTCQNSYSGLDVLINVIEQQQNDSQNTYSSSNTYIDDHHFQALEAQSLEYGHNNIELQNATSQDQLHSNNNQNSSFLYHDNNVPSVMQTQSMFPVSNPYTYYPEPTQYMPSTSTANYFMDNVSFPDQNQKRPHSSDSSSSCTSDTVLPIMLSHMSDPECQPSTSTSPSSKSRKGKKICQWCHKVFNHTGDYTKHVRTHTKEKPYPCPQCGKTFPHTSNLHRHVKTHSDQRPHKCEFCGKEFIRKDKLKFHKECCSRRRKSE
ncbi:zinc finger protein 184-like [Anthonomus grandis grandis]|uniref:zinc finger protein 184-like n=1 Tax=Anthonomus grandis grandis TaxID=2921223 RepID=UPI002165956A|nr:zinc finger protein 184-like [Anthonomus grandis grandis]XP_050294101.1 zinc finger protein 184-like [Anthonomus grandis grandis]